MNTNTTTLAAAAAAFDQFLATSVLQGRLRPATRNFYADQLKHLMRVVPNATPIGEITALELLRGPHSNHYVRACRRLWRFSKVPWPDGVPMPPCGQRDRVLTSQEFRQLRRAAAGTARWVLWLGYQTGMRPEESRDLRWGQVMLDDPEAPHIRLTRFKARDRRKDGKRIRIIPLPEVAVRALVFWRRQFHGHHGPAPDDRLFHSRLGRPWNSNSIRLAVKRARERVGLSADVVAYTIRHTWATRAARAGMDVTVLADILGHASLATTRRYLHRTAADLVAALKRHLGAGARTQLTTSPPSR